MVLGTMELNGMGKECSGVYNQEVIETLKGVAMQSGGQRIEMDKCPGGGYIDGEIAGAGGRCKGSGEWEVMGEGEVRGLGVQPGRVEDGERVT